MNLVRFLSVVTAILIAVPASQSNAQSIQLERVVTGLSSPTFATHSPGDSDRLFIAQRSGAIRILNLNTGNLNGSNFMTVPSVNTSFEGGLLGLAFHPDYENNGHFYVNYTISAGGSFRTRIARFTRTNADSANSNTLEVVIEVPQPQQNHNAGWIGFGNDGLLYVATGDGGGGNDNGTGHTAGIGNSQDITNNLLGKMLRLDVDGDDFPGDANRNYAIPSNNTFVGVTGDDEIFLYGLRNPFRCSFDRDTDDLFIADVGQNAREEIDVIPPGYSGDANMGWRLREGTIATPGVGGGQPADGIGPVYDYPRNGQFGGTSVTGGVVYRGSVSGLTGNYLFADFNSNNFWSFRFDGSAPSVHNGTNFSTLMRWNGLISTNVGSLNGIVCFGEDNDGEVYIVELSGEIYKIVGGGLTTAGTLTTVIPLVGTFDSGSNDNLVDSDDAVLKYRNANVAPSEVGAQLFLIGSVPSSSPNTLFFNFESKTSSPNLNQNIEFFNYMTNDFESVDTRDLTLTDDAFTIEMENPTNYVSATGEVRVRASVSATGPVLGSPWAWSVDVARWEIID